MPHINKAFFLDYINTNHPCAPSYVIFFATDTTSMIVNVCARSSGFSDSLQTQRYSHPTWMQHILLRWSMVTEAEPPLLLLYSRTLSLTHYPPSLRTHHSHEPRNHSHRLLLINFFIKVTDREVPGKSSVAASGDSRQDQLQDPLFGPLRAAAILNGHNDSSVRFWGLKQQVTQSGVDLSNKLRRFFL